MYGKWRIKADFLKKIIVHLPNKIAPGINCIFIAPRPVGGERVLSHESLFSKQHIGKFKVLVVIQRGFSDLSEKECRAHHNRKFCRLSGLFLLSSWPQKIVLFSPEK